MTNRSKKLVLLYHFFHPDDVISARLFSELGEEAAKDGWEVVAMPAVRSCHDGELKLPKRERWQGIDIRRVWRPAWRQSSNKGRLGNTAFMLLGWTLRALVTRRGSQETMIVGTDPPLSVLVAIPWRLLRPRARIIHWCHDLYPHAAVADGVLRSDSRLARGLNWLLRFAYRRCDCIVDLGSCMRDELLVASGEPLENCHEFGSAMQQPLTPDPSPLSTGARGVKIVGLHSTLTPWSLVEPSVVPAADEAVRKDLFGDAKLGLLYSGNLGRAHIYEPFIELAQRLRADSVSFCFAGRGPLRESLEAKLLTVRSAVAADASGELNVRLADFAAEDELQKRLAAADVHMVSLHPAWTGTVVPSKFFGALAVGRPVLFAGSGQSAIARWIRQFDVGWVIEDEAALNEVVESLRRIADDPIALDAMKQRCIEVYRSQFSKASQIHKWMQLLG